MLSLVEGTGASAEPSFVEDLGASALLVGTAIGGGFLALPHATAQSGALPSAAVLTGCWAWMLFESLLISDLVLDARENSSTSFASLGREAFEDAGGFAISVTFVVLMVTTMVSQIL